MELFPIQMSLIPFLALPAGLEVTACSQQEGRLCVSLLSRQPHAQCPLCGTATTRINGMVEGKVNKLKLIKRMGYGRAGFPLLRQRVLHAL